MSATSTLPNGTYSTDAVIGVAVSFSYPVVVVNGGYPTNCTGGGGGSSSWSTGDRDVSCEGLPVLQLDASGEHGDKNATYASGNGTAELVFEYQASGAVAQKRFTVGMRETPYLAYTNSYDPTCPQLFVGFFLPFGTSSCAPKMPPGPLKIEKRKYGHSEHQKYTHKHTHTSTHTEPP